MDDIVLVIIDVRVGFLFVVDGDLLKEFGRVSLLDKDIDEVALADLEFVCDRVIVVDDVPLLDLVVDNVDVLESFKIVFVLKGVWVEVFELLIDPVLVGVKVEVFEDVIVLVPEDDPDEDFEDVNDPEVVFVKMFVEVPFKEVVIDGELEDVLELLIERVFVVDDVEVLDGLVVIVVDDELDVVFDVVIELEDVLVFKKVNEDLDVDVNVDVNLDVNDGKIELEEVLVTVEVLVEVLDAVWVLVFLDVGVISFVTKEVFVPVVVLVDVLDWVGLCESKTLFWKPIPTLKKPINNNNFKIIFSCSYISKFFFSYSYVF